MPNALFGPCGPWCGRRVWRGGHGRHSADRASAASGLRSPVRLSRDAPVEDLGEVLGAVEFPLGAHLGQEASGVVASGFGVGEGCGQGGPSGVGEDPVGVVGEGRAEVPLEAAGGLGSWCVAGQLCQDGCGGLLVAGLEVAEGFVGCCGLLLVAALLVPLRGGSGQVHGGEEQGDGESARFVGGVGEFLGGLAQSVGCFVVGAGGGATGAVERRGGCTQLCAVRAGCGAGDVVEGVAESGELALGGRIVIGVEDRVRRLYRGDGVLPRLARICREPGAVGYLLVGETFAEPVNGEVGGELRAAVPDRFMRPCWCRRVRRGCSRSRRRFRGRGAS